MAQYFREFSDADGISDWTQREAVSGSDAPTWAIQNTVEVISSSASNHREYLVWDDIDADANRAHVEVYGMQKIPANSTTNRVAVVRLSGVGGTGYDLRLRPADIALYRFTGATATQVAVTSITGGTAGEWWHYRFKTNATDGFKVRVWEDGGSEPGTWDIDTTDSTYSTAGHVGLAKGANTNDHIWKKFGVGTNGDAAPTSGAPPPATVTLSNLEGYDITSSGFKLRLDYDFA